MSQVDRLVSHTGSCHCQTIVFEVRTPEGELEVEECNCSICKKKAYLHLIVPKTRFQVIQGKEFLSKYTFNTHLAEHLFCGRCGVAPFYVPRSNPDGIDVNVRCIDTDLRYKVVSFDGRDDWENCAKRVEHKSKE
ncbi:uncharacterized protein VTP21DRAFT_10490 [Calcarisporiella thermophila]|uniref:uncharacterized protein n=1 Tax=Calcarisporiella thermophila TaxID=911321 RepID=UPI003741FB7E